jgi:hypothetical protein
MNQNTIYNRKRFRRRRTPAVPSLQSKCYFHINKTSERPKTLKLKFKLQQTNFLITANSVQKELLPRFFPHYIPTLHSQALCRTSFNSRQSLQLQQCRQAIERARHIQWIYSLKFVDRFLITVADVNDTSSPGRDPSIALTGDYIVGVDKLPKRNEVQTIHRECLGDLLLQCQQTKPLIAYLISINLWPRYRTQSC